MLVIRLQRTGRRNVPAYRIVVADKRSAVKGKVKEYVGHYLPTRDPHEFVYKQDRIEHWIKFGAQPSNTLARLLKKAGVTGLDKFIKTYTKKKKRKEEEPKEAPPAATKPEKSVETPYMASQDEAKEKEKPKTEEKPEKNEEKPDDTKDKKE
jgi:small subunit ribosomal protein S16